MPFEKPEEDFDVRRARLESGNKSVTQPIARIDKDIVKRKNAGGRKKKYSPTKLRNEINRYFDWCENKDQIPSIKGMMLYLKMYPDMFYVYLKYPEYSDIMETARLAIAEWCERDVYNTKGLAGGKISYMKSVHSWTDKIEHNSTVTQIQISPQEARAKIEALAPKLLEVLKSNNLLNQLVLPEKTIDAEVVKSDE